MQTSIQQQLTEALNQRRSEQRLRQLNTVNAISASEVAGTYAGRRQTWINFSSNDYLGLSHHPDVVAAMASAGQAGSKASPLVTGYSSIHHDLALQLADYLQRDRVLLFSSAFAANAGALTTLGRHYQHLWLDRLSHASLLNGARHCGAPWRRFGHQDFDSLQQRLGSGSQLVIAESIYSMDGDELDHFGWRRIVGADQVDGYLDDAHGFGVLGAEGAGACELYSQQQLSFVSLAFGKATGVAGGALAVPESVADYLINFCPEYIYSTAMPLAQASAIKASVTLMQSAEGRLRRALLRERIEQFKSGCQALGLPITASNSAIQGVIVGADRKALELSEALRAAGIWCSAIRPPTVPEGSARLRITLTTAHSESQVAHLINALDQAREKL
ncbi:8-amino-7-oxononanoate synthase [Pseudidiomarina piscicola]|uniref:8-amino-7-oxononanoate synthase n=1 Tax=Pseudidiomarina piscicola TaxID=2614830 RepID=A0A6S6WL16_9GAMM|nr:8-amino-7-oxononanoate synthase [Pseudidiomarina piscicola]CAB0149924.1 8-amino-7-oxononanoate synthase [Pseudidiomarina piscicola]VZT39371.1 8-amino-7-oxononanoate synthase [Pseudomonas aeruginosa]